MLKNTIMVNYKTKLPPSSVEGTLRCFYLLYLSLFEIEKNSFVANLYSEYSSYTFLDPRDSSFRTMPYLVKSRTLTCGCSLVKNAIFPRVDETTSG